MIDLQEKLSRLKNRATRYELIAERIDASGAVVDKVLVVYTARNNRHGLIDGIIGKADKIIKLTGRDEWTFPGRGAPVVAIFGEWRIRFSGRTQRDAYLGGELEFIGDRFPTAAEA